MYSCGKVDNDILDILDQGSIFGTASTQKICVWNIVRPKLRTDNMLKGTSHYYDQANLRSSNWNTGKNDQTCYEYCLIQWCEFGFVWNTLTDWKYSY